MENNSRPIPSDRALRAVRTGALIVGLCLLGTGCGAFGSGKGAPPDAPSDLTGESGDSVVRLHWKAVEGADTYNVYRNTSSLGTTGTPLAEGISSTSYADTGLENGTTYSYQVTAVGAGGSESAPSNEVRKTPFSAPPESPGR